MDYRGSREIDGGGGAAAAAAAAAATFGFRSPPGAQGGTSSPASSYYYPASPYDSPQGGHRRSSRASVTSWVITTMVFIFLASWPFFPVLIQFKPWPVSKALVFATLLCCLAWVLVKNSAGNFSAVLSSGLTLALTGLTCIQYTAQTKCS